MKYFFYFYLFFHIRDMLMLLLYRVLEAGEKHDTGDENSLIFDMGK